MQSRRKDAALKKLEFLNFPPEIRIMIYEYLFGGIYITLGTDLDNKKVNGWPAVTLTRSESIPAQIFRSCRQINAEASVVFFQQAHFRLSVSADMDAWMDATKGKLRAAHPYFSEPEDRWDVTGEVHWSRPLTGKIQHLHLVIDLGPYSATDWLASRMSQRKNCVLFGQMTALRCLDISMLLTTWRWPWSTVGTYPIPSLVDSADGEEDIVCWLAQAIPSDVELRWTAGTCTTEITYVEPDALKRLQEKYEDRRGTACSIARTKRNKRPSGTDPDFMAAWSAREKERRLEKKLQKQKAAESISSIEEQTPSHMET